MELNSERKLITLLTLLLVTLLVAGILVWVSNYRGSIPNIEMSLTPVEKEKLSEIGSVKLKRAGFFDIDCKSYTAHEFSYSITSSNSSRSDDYAKWSCGPSLRYVDCPEIKVSIQGEQALIESGLTQKSEYGLEQVKMCASLAIKNAPTELRATNSKVTKSNSEAENLRSYQLD